MTRQPYPKPPIIEAVIEFVLNPAATVASVEKVEKRVKKRYVTSEPHGQREVTVDLATGQRMNVKDISKGFRLWSKDRTDILIVTTAVVAFGRLAPYVGWEAYTARARRDWEDWIKVVPRVNLSRIGVRFINRIDVPLTSGTPQRAEDYLNIYPNISQPAFGLLTNFLVQAEWPIPTSNCIAKVVAGTTRSALLGHAALLLDIDVSQIVSLPSDTDGLWTLIDSIRGHKNEIFERLVTDKARRTFGHE